VTRERVVSVHIPVVMGGGSGGSGGGVGAMVGAVLAVIVVAVLMAVAVKLAYPSPTYQPVTDCRPFCSVYNTTTPAAGGEQR
jgi:hypothetical protein